MKCDWNQFLGRREGQTLQNNILFRLLGAVQGGLVAKGKHFTATHPPSLNKLSKTIFLTTIFGKAAGAKKPSAKCSQDAHLDDFASFCVHGLD